MCMEYSKPAGKYYSVARSQVELNVVWLGSTYVSLGTVARFAVLWFLHCFGRVHPQDELEQLPYQIRTGKSPLLSRFG
jgi:hypothetical protein